MVAYSMDLRERVAACREDGMGTGEVAEVFGCSESWVRRLMQRRRDLGTLAPLVPRKFDRRKLKDEDLGRLRRLVAEKPDATLAELAADLGHKAGESTVCRALKKLGLARKKSPCTPPSRTGRT